MSPEWIWIDELWSSNHQIDFFEKPYFAFYAVLHPKIFTCIIECPRHASAHPTRDGGLHNNFLQWGSKICLKCSVQATRTFTLRGVAPRNFTTWCATRWGCSNNVQIFPQFRTTFEFDR